MLKESWLKALGECKSFRCFGAIVCLSHLAFVNTVRWPKFSAPVQVVYTATISDYRHANLVEEVALIAIELVHVLFALDNALKMISNSIYGNVFKLTSEVYLVALKGYVKMRCSSKIGCVEVGEFFAFTVLALWVNHRLNSHVVNLATSFQQCSQLNICFCSCHPTEIGLANKKACGKVVVLQFIVLLF
ncbi:unnamed protein product [Trifolium pratense]|uniref:Uncharacterized protein n=1 Tax=Trifolium pratense TaxID=57577 RepID=A0ACB0KDY6_TRIPR|nr:unnamed protein product [Trifolium pratense]